MPSVPRPSPQGLTVLSLLQAGPLHPYGMQRLIRLWGKDDVVNIGQRANLYKTIKRLHDAGLIAVRQTERDQQYPERTVYEVTEDGLRVAHTWLVEMLSTARNEYPVFPAALSFIMVLSPEAAAAALEERAAAVETRLAAIEAELGDFADKVPRVVLLDPEYLRAVTAAELTWLRGVIQDIKSGALTWSRELIEAALSG